MVIQRRRLLSSAGLIAPALALSSASAQAHDGRQPSIHTGADRLAATGWASLRGRKVGVFANPTAVLSDMSHIVDSMIAHGITPSAAFGPEHGFRGTAQAGGSEGNYRDPRTGVAVYDAYGVSVEDLTRHYRKADIDTLVFDIASVGARFYTYNWALYTAMRAAVRAHVSVMVLDRPNPIGNAVRGPLVDAAHTSAVGLKPIAQQPGLTLGELARLFDSEYLLDDEGRRSPRLQISTVSGWRSAELFADTGLSWVAPSPNMPTPETALLYPGTCLFEGTVFSTGRGTCRPFETIGAPGVDWRWAEKLNEFDLPGVTFRETNFVPTFSNFVGQSCGGVQVHLAEPSAVDAIELAVVMLHTAKRLYPDFFAWRDDHYVDLLSGSTRLREMIDRGAAVEDIVSAWQPELNRFRAIADRYRLYR